MPIISVLLTGVYSARPLCCPTYFFYPVIIISRRSIYRRSRECHSSQVVEGRWSTRPVVIVRRSSCDLIENVARRRRRTSKFTSWTPRHGGGLQETVLVNRRGVAYWQDCGADWCLQVGLPSTFWYCNSCSPKLSLAGMANDWPEFLNRGLKKCRCGWKQNFLWSSGKGPQ